MLEKNLTFDEDNNNNKDDERIDLEFIGFEVRH